MTHILVEVLFILLLIAANGLFAMAELAVVSARKARLKEWADRGDRKAQAALDLAGDPNRFLATVQVGITLVGTLAGVFGGATIAENLATRLGRVPARPLRRGHRPDGRRRGHRLLLLVFGELVPKRLAMSNPERIASAVAGPLRRLSVVGVPLVRLLSLSTEAVLRVLGVRPVDRAARHGRGGQRPAEGGDAGRGLRAGRAGHGQAGLPAGRPAGGGPDDARLGGRLDGHRRPARGGPTQDHGEPPFAVPGLRGDARQRPGGRPGQGPAGARLRSGGPSTSGDILKVPQFIYEGMPGLKVLELFKASATHMGVVLSEYGSVEGVLTLNDILQAVVGDLPRMPRRPTRGR